MQKLHSASEAAQILGVTRDTIIEYIKSERLAGSLIGRRYRIRQEDLDQFIRNQRVSRSK